MTTNGMNGMATSCLDTRTGGHPSIKFPEFTSHAVKLGAFRGRVFTAANHSSCRRLTSRLRTLLAVLMSQDALPLYQQIADELRRNIQESVFRVGDRLPTETELSKRFGVNRHTLRRAMEVLRHEGIVNVERGRGTFVVAAPITLSIGRRVRFNESLKAQSVEPQWQILQVTEIPADPRVALNLALTPGAAVVLYERLSLADDVPLSLASSYFPSQPFPNLVEHCQTYRSISVMLQTEYGCDHIRRSTRLSARLPQAKQARILRMPATKPILLSESVNIDQAGRVIEFGVTQFRGDRTELYIEND